MNSNAENDPSKQIVFKSSKSEVPTVQVPIGSWIRGQDLKLNCTLTPTRSVRIVPPPGSEMSVPLQVLQSLKAGQGIPTGQPGILLAKMPSGELLHLKFRK